MVQISGWPILLKKLMVLFRKYGVIFLIGIVFVSCRAMKEPDYKSIDSFSIKSVSGDTSTIALNLRYYNPNRHKLRLKEAEGDAYIDSVYLGHFSMDTVVRIKKLSDFNVPVILKANMKNISRNALSVFMKKEFNVRLEGHCKVGKGGIYFPYVIHYEGKQALKLF